MNRRISLVVLNEKTERQIRGMPEEPEEEIQTEADAEQLLGLDAGAEADAPVDAAVAEPQVAQPDAARAPL